MPLRRGSPALSILLLATSCDSLPPAPRPAAGPGSASASAPLRAAVAAPAAVDAGGPYRPGARLVEVELSGRAALPTDAPQGKLLVLAADGPCFQPGTHYLGTTTQPPGGTFFVEIFPPEGTMLEICGALVEAGRPEVRYRGHALGAPFRAQGRGEVEFKNLSLPLVAGAAAALPAGLRVP